ncbi:Polyvinylalcohol dehydrogenase-like [Melia azedarach]|uniref:Polyvinylalcohol dehydrogenase-like n=1 Tax=Melia azedarach TaxID=155640 RepID=A0ACC1X8N2_MELAZ|nr:Polyvinylalcohol dehydrogenase-like [Melia azedarach]
MASSNLCFAIFPCMFTLLVLTAPPAFANIIARRDPPLLTKSHEQQHWLNHGGDLHNRRYAEKETKINPQTVSMLSLKWKFYAGNDITATPAIFDGTLYFPSWNGYIYAVRASDGYLLWKKNLEALTDLNGTGLVLNVNVTVSRSTPTVAGKLLIFGIYGPAVVIAVKRLTGELVWKTKLDDHAASVVTMSGTYYNGSVNFLK